MSQHVTCIMPTAGRRRFIPLAVRYFLEQTFADSDLLIYDNGECAIRDLVPESPRITYFHRPDHLESVDIGTLRNICCDVARGPYIAHWDDDDWSHPQRLEEQLQLIESCEADLVGYWRMHFYDERHHKLYSYGDNPLYVIGTSFLYRKEFWRHHHFASKDVGEDNDFADMCRVQTADGSDPLRMIARVHSGTNTPKPFHADPFTKIEDAQLIEKIQGVLR